MNLEKLHDLWEWPVIIFFMVGIGTAAFDFTLAGFTSPIRFFISLWFLIMIICFELTMIREKLNKKNEVEKKK